MEAVAATAGAPPEDLFALLCERRGWTPQYLDDINTPDHDALMDIDLIVEALHELHTTGTQVIVSPDFDTDGISSGVLGYAGLAELGLDVVLSVPDYRLGHELSPAAVEQMRRRFPRAGAMITCDGGVNSHEGIAAARALGWRVLVTDHHEELPPGCTADVVVDPCRIDETYAHPGICGAHVLWQVLHAYAVAHRPDKLWEIHLLRLLAGLGTVSDVMPLLWENRDLVRDSLSIARLLYVQPPAGPDKNRWGDPVPHPEDIDVSDAVLLQLLAAGDHHPAFVSAFRGFAVLLKALACADKLRGPEGLDENLYGFYIAPALNSPRRIESPLEPCFELFTSPSTDAQLRAANEALTASERRRQMVAEQLEALASCDQPWAPWVYLCAPGVPTGMYGLLANSLMSSHGHPVVVMGAPSSPDEPVSGSSRSPSWFAMIDALAPVDGMGAIGHQQACGVALERASYLPDLVAVLQSAVQQALAQMDPDARPGDLRLGPDADCDASLTEVEALTGLVERIDELAPFGAGFTRPVMEVVMPASQVQLRRIGSEHQHLRIWTPDIACLWWNQADRAEPGLRDWLSRARDGDRLRLLGRLQVNEFRGTSTIQLVVDDVVTKGVAL